MIKSANKAAPIPARDVNECKPAMSLEQLRIKTPEGFVFRNRHGHFGDLTTTDTLCDEHPHLSWVETFRRLCQLDFGVQAISRPCRLNEFHLEPHHKTTVSVLH